MGWSGEEQRLRPQGEGWDKLWEHHDCLYPLLTPQLTTVLRHLQNLVQVVVEEFQ